MITSLESTHLAVEFLRAGGDMFLVKPVNFDILELIIKEVLEKARLRTQYREAHEALAKSEAHARAVIETSPNAIVTFAEDGTIRKFYGAAERIFDYRARMVEGEGIGVLFAEQSENAPGIRVRGSGLVDAGDHPGSRWRAPTSRVRPESPGAAGGDEDLRTDYLGSRLDASPGDRDLPPGRRLTARR